MLGERIDVGGRLRPLHAAPVLAQLVLVCAPHRATRAGCDQHLNPIPWLAGGLLRAGRAILGQMRDGYAGSTPLSIRPPLSAGFYPSTSGSSRRRAMRRSGRKNQVQRATSRYRR